MIMMPNTVFQFAGMVMCMTVLVSAGPTCLECADVVAPTDCEFVRTCGDHEKCFLDTFVTSGGAIRFTMGCRDTKQCTSSAGKRDIDRERRSNGDVLVCNACCDNKAMCNNALCQTKGYPTARGPICFNCKDQNGTNDCQMITMCGQDEMCMLHITSNSVTHAQRYETKCEPIQQCLRSVNTMHQSIGIIGKRTSNAVELYGKCMIQCCDSDLCNNNCLNTGGSIINILTTTPRPATVDHCHSSPCHNGGICSSSSTSFSCRCATGFTGSTCTTHVDHCSPNPCIHGTCHSSSSGYTCSCDATYYGNNCQTKDYCANNPCIHGSCTNHASSYSCHCNSGYTGNTCDQRVVNHCSPNPCIHGTCHSSSSGYTCSCHATYYGNNCQTKDHCANNPCPHGYCTNHASSFTCHCDRGYTGNTCDQRDYCAIDHCQHGACVNMASSYKCNCYSGYTGTNCQTAVSSHSPLSVGDKVVPGPDWFLDEKVSIGTVTRMNDLDHPQSVWVLWNTGLITVSQYGHNGKYEVVHA